MSIFAKILFWEQRKLINILSQPVTDGPHETPKLVKKGIPFISADAITDNKINFNRKRGFISEAYNIECNKKYKPKRLDVYLVKSGSTVGKVAVVNTDITFNIWSPIAAMRLNTYNDPYFLFYLLQTDKMQIQIKNKSKGGTQPNLSMRILEKFDIQIPTNKNDQKKISKLLQKIDNLISLQQRKYDLVNEIFKSILKKIYRSNKNLYSLKFKNDTSSWKESHLGKIINFINGRAFKQKELLPRGKYPVLRVGNFFSNDVWYYSNLDLSSDKYAQNGDLLYTWSAAFGPHIWTGPKVIFHYHIWKLRFDEKIISKMFLFYFLKYDKNNLLANSNGSTMIHVTKENMEEKRIIYPSLSQQQDIGNLLLLIANKEDFCNKILCNYKKIKKFLLQNMFI